MLKRQTTRRILGVQAMPAVKILLAIIMPIGLPGIALAENSFDTKIRNNFSFAATQLNNSTQAISTTNYPLTTNSSGAWSTTGASFWTSGFFPGSLWFKYQESADSTWQTKALNWQAGIESQKDNISTHDLGFMIFNSFGNGYRLTGNDAYRQVALKAASSLATRYSSTVGCFKSWNGKATDFKVIIDNMVNLELMFWAAKHGGQSAWHDMAVSHALKTSQEHVRSDGSTYHVINYNPSTGAVKTKGTHQGYSNSSTWARGQAWAIYGFTMTYRETGDARFLVTARKVADYYLSRLPSDKVPYWDFDAPDIPNEPRDSSAAAIAASGLFELSFRETDANRKTKYFNAAKSMLNSLSSSVYLAQGSINKAILLHGTYYKLKGNYDTGTIWGDYYFLEALLRYRWFKPSTTAHKVVSAIASANDGNVPANAIDNNLGTRWTAGGDGQWIRFDLGSTKTVTKVTMAFYKGSERTAQFNIQASKDGTTWTTAYSGISSGTTNQQETYDFSDMSARYVRILGYGNTQNNFNSITEVDIY